MFDIFYTNRERMILSAAIRDFEPGAVVGGERVSEDEQSQLLKKIRSHESSRLLAVPPGARDTAIAHGNSWVMLVWDYRQGVAEATLVAPYLVTVRVESEDDYVSAPTRRARPVTYQEEAELPYDAVVCDARGMVYRLVPFTEPGAKTSVKKWLRDGQHHMFTYPARPLIRLDGEHNG